MDFGNHRLGSEIGTVHINRVYFIIIEFTSPPKTFGMESNNIRIPI